MKYPKYELESSQDLEVFQFLSEGSQGSVVKIIQFSKTPLPDLYNLAFGDKNPDNTFDDTSLTRNGDMEKVLATVADAVYKYTDRFTERSIIFAGSSLSRTRLYRMAIARNYKQLDEDFHIFGVHELKGKNIKTEFIFDGNYIAFIVSRKRVNS